MDSSASPSPFLSLTGVLRSLSQAVAGWGTQGAIKHVLATLIIDRLRGVMLRMEVLAAKFQAGVVVRRVAPVVVAADAVVVPRAPRPKVARVWPHRFAWLVTQMTWHVTPFGSLLRNVLIEPEMVALFTACPQARRVLTPVCRMLGVERSVLRPGYVAPVREPRPKAPRKKRPSDLIYYPPRGGPGLGCPSTLVINRRTGHVRYKLPWHKR